jgi:hypothetical protein
MDESLRAQIDSNLSHLDALIRRGRRLQESLSADASDKSALVANRAWQQDIGVAINQLSGGSKAHWLARAFSEAFLMRTTNGQVIEAVAPAEIVERLLGVLDQAVLSLARMGEGESAGASSATAAPLPRRFEFVHNAELRPVLEQAYIDGRDALEQGGYGQALMNTCGILEAIVTDALEFRGAETLVDVAIPTGKIGDWSFGDRLSVAEKAGIIRGGCARLPEVARRYREIAGPDGSLQTDISERDARRTMQVLHVVMRDLDPGR